MVLIPAFVCGVEERRPAIAYAAGLAAGGLLLFSLYCAIHFGDPLAFVQAQRGWRPSLGFLLAGLVEDADANFSWHDELEAWLD